MKRTTNAGQAGGFGIRADEPVEDLVAQAGVPCCPNADTAAEALPLDDAADSIARARALEPREAVLDAGQ